MQIKANQQEGAFSYLPLTRRQILEPSLLILCSKFFLSGCEQQALTRKHHADSNFPLRLWSDKHRPFDHNFHCAVIMFIHSLCDRDCTRDPARSFRMAGSMRIPATGGLQPYRLPHSVHCLFRGGKQPDCWGYPRLSLAGTCLSRRLGYCWCSGQAEPDVDQYLRSLQRVWFGPDRFFPWFRTRAGRLYGSLRSWRDCDRVLP